MTTSVKNIVTNFKNTSKSLINANNYDNSVYPTQFNSLSQGNDFNTYLTSFKNKAIEGFDCRSSLIDTTESVLLDAQISNAQQAELSRLKSEYLLKQTSYNSLINSISSGTNNSSKLQQMKELETTLDSLSRQIKTLNDVITENIGNVNDQISTNSIERMKYMTSITNNKADEADRANLSNNIQNMLNDSNIRTLQTNYSFILFSIFAATSVIVAMNIVRKD